MRSDMSEINAKCIIVDDDFFSLNHLKNELASYGGIVVSGFAMNAKDGSDLILKFRPDLVFLDIELPDYSGLDLLRRIKEKVDWSFHVVFYTAYNKYLLEALRESAFDYLLKPFETKELDQVLNRYHQHCLHEKKDQQFHDSLVRILPDKHIYLVATIDGLRILHLNQIGYFKYLSDKKLWNVILSDSKELQLKRNTKASDIMEYSPSFVQINRDQIVNMGYLSMIKGNKCILFPPFEHVTDLSVSSGYMKQLMLKYSQI